MTKTKLTARHWFFILSAVMLFMIASKFFGLYDYFISTLFIRIVQDANRYEITALSSDFKTTVAAKDIFNLEERESPSGFAFPIFFDRVNFRKGDFKREYRVDMYEDDKKVFSAYLSSMSKEKATPLAYYPGDNPENDKLIFYDINGKYYALEIMGIFLCFSENQSERLAEILK